MKYNSQVFSDIQFTDTVYGANDQGYPTALGGVIDENNQVHPVWIAAARETTQDWVWIFTQMLEANGHVAPRVLACDFADVILSAAEKSFPKTFVLNCHVHLRRFLSKGDKLHMYKDHGLDMFLKDFFNVVNQISQTQFEEERDVLLEKYPAFSKYYDTTLRPKEKNWARYSRIGFFSANADSTNFEESLNHALKAVIGRTTVLAFFLGVLEYALRKERTSKKLANKILDFGVGVAPIFGLFLNEIQMFFTNYVSKNIVYMFHMSPNYDVFEQESDVTAEFIIQFSSTFQMNIPASAQGTRLFVVRWVKRTTQPTEVESEVFNPNHQSVRDSHLPAALRSYQGLFVRASELSQVAYFVSISLPSFLPMMKFTSTLG